MTQKKILLVGGGIGGLATALACGMRGLQVQLIEKKPAFSEVGAGIQLSPNVVGLLEGWGLRSGLDAVACFPALLQVRSAQSEALLGQLALGARAVQRYGARYATIARADLQNLLLGAVQAQGSTQLLLNNALQLVSQDANAVQVTTTDGHQRRANVVIGADGLWSDVRDFVRTDAQPRFSGHLAYRAMVPQAALPQALRSDVITAWLGPRFHAVQYPVHGGQWLNVVVIVEGPSPKDIHHWDHEANAHDLHMHLQGAASALQDLVAATKSWRLWPLNGLPHLRSAQELAFGRIALMGDAAHPMLPYLAQGAGMAIEDAASLADVLSQPALGDMAALERYAQTRWRRNARVQARAQRNGEIFHASGLQCWGRDTAMQLLGQRLLDVPWLYGGR
ncbi:MAG: FAD-dependent monooxygenase [Betaproteobacteria bacterium]